MAAIMLSAVVLAIAGLAPSAVASHCETETGIPIFDPNYLCGQTFQVLYTSFNAQETDCAYGKFTCGSDKRITMETNVRRNGVLNPPSTSVLTQAEGRTGVLFRKFTNNDTPITMVVKGYSEARSDDQGKRCFKMAYSLCAQNSDDILAKSVITNCPKNTVWDEKNILLVEYENGGMALLPNTCPTEDFDN